jgi:hypothetical protein
MADSLSVRLRWAILGLFKNQIDTLITERIVIPHRRRPHGGGGSDGLFLLGVGK